MIIDSHCHLDYLAKKGADIDAVIHDAKKEGVQAFLSVATTIAADPVLREFCEQYPEVYRSVGLHPNHADEAPNVTCAELVALSHQPKVIALGECGIDYFHDACDPKVQRNVFEAHIQAAQETGLPLIIHTRDADEDTISIMRQGFKNKAYRGVFHCFTGSPAILKAAKEFDFYLSVTGIVTYGKSTQLREIVPQIAPNRLMVETDAPFLAPKPYRGKQCAPFMVVHTAQLLAEIFNLPYGEFAALTTNNFCTLFDQYSSSTN